MRRIALVTMILCAPFARAADRVAYVERQVVRYEGDRAFVATELVATVVSDAPVVEKKAAPAVAVTTFQKFVSGSYHAGHDCPNCGTEQTRIGNDAGPNHDHTCPKCGTSWYHMDAVSTGTTLKVMRRLFGR